MREDQYVSVGDINTRFRAAGDSDKTVILLHGLGDSLETWIYNLDALAAHFRVYAVDLVGYGRSDKPPADYSGEYFAQFVSAFLETQGIQRCTLVGHSMGGGVSLRFAARFPGKVDKLVLEGSAGFGREISIFLRLATLPPAGEWFFRPSRKLVTRILKRCVYDPDRITGDLVERVYQMLTLPGAKHAILSTLRTSCNLWGTRREALHPVLDHLSSLPMPTLILWGGQDRVLPLAHARVAERKIPNARLHILDSCGHATHLECPETFNSIVLEFLLNKDP